MDEWVRPATLPEAWSGASLKRRCSVRIALAVFALGIVVWLGGWFVPIQPPPGTWWTIALGWVPIAGFVTGGIACLALMTGPVRGVTRAASLALVTQWAEVVHRLTKVALDQFELELGTISAPPDNGGDTSGDFDDVLDHLEEAPPSTVRDIVESTAALAPRWQVRLLGALREIVALENTPLPKRSYSSRLQAAPAEVQRGARWGPAFLALAFVVIFAGALGTIVLGLFGLHPAWKAPGGLFVGPLGGAVIAWFGAQLSTVPDNRRPERLQAIAKSLGTTREQSS